MNVLIRKKIFYNKTPCQSLSLNNDLIVIIWNENWWTKISFFFSLVVAVKKKYDGYFFGFLYKRKHTFLIHIISFFSFFRNQVTFFLSVNSWNWCFFLFFFETECSIFWTSIVFSFENFIIYIRLDIRLFQIYLCSLIKLFLSLTVYRGKARKLEQLRQWMTSPRRGKNS